MNKAFVIEEQPIVLPSVLTMIDPVDTCAQLYVRCGTLEQQAETERQISVRNQRELLLGLLEVADALDRILQRPLASGESAAAERQHRNVSAARRLLAQKLERVGVTPVLTLGQLHDPAVADIEGYRADPNAPEETVLFEVQAGYYWHKTLLRRAKVLVAHSG